MLLIRSQVLYLSKIWNKERHERVADERWEWRRLGFEENEELTRSDEGKTKDGKLGQCWGLEKWMCMRKWISLEIPCEAMCWKRHEV